MFPVRPEKESALRNRLESLGINEGDIIESFIRSGGRGGQRLNKTETCVYLKHIPTGIEVKCQKTRSQGLNRYYARQILCDKVESLIKGREGSEAQRIYRIRKQKMRRSKRAKEKILTEKRLQSIKKMERTLLYEEDIDV
ncbi:MAG: peptide chain release factor-like protein [Thermodesulfovibrionia bacterium]